jgi:hypothetical protein
MRIASIITADPAALSVAPSRVPGVEVGAEHDDFRRAVGSGNLCHDVE